MFLNIHTGPLLFFWNSIDAKTTSSFIKRWQIVWHGPCRCHSSAFSSLGKTYCYSISLFFVTLDICYMLLSNHSVSLATFKTKLFWPTEFILYGHCIWNFYFDTSIFFTLQLVKLDSLALYWNSNDDIEKLPSQEEWQVITLRTDLSLHHLIERFFIIALSWSRSWLLYLLSPTSEKTVLNQYHRKQYLQAFAQEMSVHPAIAIHQKLWAQVLHIGTFSGI